VTRERRKYPRIKTRLPVEVVADGEILSATAFNLSQAGLELGCDHRTTIYITPRSYRTMPGDNATAHLRVRLQDRAVVAVHCKVVHCRRLARDDYRLGMRFLAFEQAEAESALIRYLDQRLQQQ